VLLFGLVHPGTEAILAGDRSSNKRHTIEVDYHDHDDTKLKMRSSLRRWMTTTVCDFIRPIVSGRSPETKVESNFLA